MGQIYDICLIDYFPNYWLDEPHKNTFIWNVIEHDFQEAEDSVGIPRGHGIAVLDIMQTVNPAAMICLIPITGSTSVRQINFILSKIIQSNKTRIINISFGFYLKETDVAVQEMQLLCRRANEQGVSIVCAKSNDKVKAYPADCDFSIPVWGIQDCETDIAILPNGITVRCISMHVNWCDNRKLWVHGNSFLAPIVSSLISKFGNLKLAPQKLLESFRLELLLNGMKLSNKIIDE